MRHELLLLLTLCAILVATDCHREYVTVVAQPVEEEVSYYKTLRGGIPPPPITPWWTLNEDNLEGCQFIIWRYLQRIYPIEEETLGGYQVFGLDSEPDDLNLNRSYIKKFQYFFSIHLWRNYIFAEDSNCTELLNRVFFDQAMAEPTCKIRNESEHKITYMYNIKTKYRRGGCPTIVDKPDFHCDARHTQYCGFLRVVFSDGDGQLIYIDFVGT